MTTGAKKGDGTVYADSVYTKKGNDSKPYPILATPEQMKDAEALQALGFDIIIPDE